MTHVPKSIMGLPNYVNTSDKPNCPGFVSGRVQQTSKKFRCHTETTWKSMGVEDIKSKMAIFWAFRQ